MQTCLGGVSLYGDKGCSFPGTREGAPLQREVLLLGKWRKVGSSPVSAVLVPFSYILCDSTFLKKRKRQ